MDGKARKLSRIFKPDGKTIIVPLDDSLIFGPFDGLGDIRGKINSIIEGSPDAILAYQGVYKNDIISNELGRIINISASTTNSCHTRKVIISAMERLIFYDADCVAVHINLSSKYETEMLSNFGLVIEEAAKYALPVLAIAYPRKENLDGTDDNYIELKESSNVEYTKLLCHCVRMARDMGADVVKTQYCGNEEFFSRVIEAAYPLPVVIAGGVFKESFEMLKMAEEAIRCGCKGISFGRNIFSRVDSTSMIKAISSIVHDNKTAEFSFSKYSPSNEKNG